MDRSPTPRGGLRILHVAAVIAASLGGTGCLIDRVANAYGNIGAGEAQHSPPSPPVAARTSEPAVPPPPFLTESGVKLLDPDHRYRPTGAKETRDLAHFEPVALGVLGPLRCLAVTVTPGSDAKPNPAATERDAYFEFVPPHLKATRREDGALVAGDVCNQTAEPLPLSLALARQQGGPEPGTGTVTVEVHERVVFPAMETTPFLAGGVLSPPTERTYVPVGAPESRQLERYKPVSVAIPSGECYAFEAKLGAGAKVDSNARMSAHLWTWMDRRDVKNVHQIAQREVDGRMISIAYCNMATSEPLPMDIALVSKDDKAPGNGPVLIQVLKQEKDTKKTP
ncbi:MAG: hypothetical protein U0441_15925 [Polyangiaceae bacterium]